MRQAQTKLSFNIQDEYLHVAVGIYLCEICFALLFLNVATTYFFNYLFQIVLMVDW